MIEKLRFTNSKTESLNFDGLTYAFTGLNGLGDVDAEIQTQKSPYQDGMTYISSNLSTREISVEILILGTGNEDISEKRTFLAKILNPKLGPGTLTYTIGDKVREITALVNHVPIYSATEENRQSLFQTALVDFICPDPYWRSEKEHIEQLVTFSGGLTFPLVLPTIFGNQKADAKSRIIVNDGDSSTPIEVTFEGPATSPIRIENETTGKFIEIAQSLLVGEKLWISTAFGKKRVEKITVDETRTNAFNYINLQSTFFQLDPGNNLLTYSTGEDYEKAPVTIRFYPRYLAV